MSIYRCAIEKDCFVVTGWAGKKEFISVVTSARDIRLGANSGLSAWGPSVLLSEEEALLMAENIIEMIKEKREATQ